MFFDWFRRRRRLRILENAFPPAWENLIQTSILQIKCLTPELHMKLQQLIQIFVAEKNWEGCNGLILTEEMKVIIAAYACLLVIGFDYDEHFENVLSILVYPTDFVGKQIQSVGGGMVLEGEQARIGEAWYRGPVVLSWSDIQREIARHNPGRNVIIHEFAHQLDMLNGRYVDGTPPIMGAEKLARWQEVTNWEFDELSASCRIGEETFIDCYGATNRAEFFAVTSESFFEAPRAMRHYHPELYAVMSDYYRQDPAAWGVIQPWDEWEL